MGDIQDQTRHAVDAAKGSTWVERGVRVGLVAYGLVHLVIAWSCVQLALGDRSDQASSKGALSELAKQPFGTVLMWIIVVGMAALVLWQLLEAVEGDPAADDNSWGHRIGAGMKAVIYAVIGFSAAKIAIGSGSSGGGKDAMTAKLMDLPGGQLLVVMVGLGIIGYGCFQIYQGVSEKFAEKLASEGKSGTAGSAYLAFGKIGHIAKGLAYAVVGGLFVWAGISHQAKKSGGLDQALTTVLHQPFGPYLVGAIGVGIACYGLFTLARARHLSR